MVDQKNVVRLNRPGKMVKTEKSERERRAGIAGRES